MTNKTDSYENIYYLKLLVRSSFFIFFTTIISKIASYGYKVLIARSFGVEAYGLFSLAIIVITITSSIATIGLGDGLVRYISFYRGKKKYGHIRKLISSSKKLFLIIGLSFLIILILIAPIIAERIFHTSNFAPLLIGMAFALPFLLLSNLFLGILRGFERIQTYSLLINVYQNTARFVILGSLILIGTGFIAISISYVLTYIGLFLISRHFASKDIAEMPKSDIPKWKEVMPEVLSYAWPLLFVGILYSVFYWTDTLILGYFTSAENVGIYSSAVTLASLFGIAPDLFMQLFFPLISVKFSEGKKETIKKITQQVVKWIYILNFAVFLGLFLFPGELLNLFFGKEFIIASPVLQILSIGGLICSVLGISTSLLAIRGKTKTVLTNFLVFATINIILDLAFISVYGMVGVALATVFTQVIFMITVLFQVNKSYGFNPLGTRIIRWMTVIVVITAISLYFNQYNFNLIYRIFYGGVILISYFVTLYFLKVFDIEDKLIFNSIILKFRAKKLKY